MSWIAAAVGIGTALYGGYQAKDQASKSRQALKSMDPFGKYRSQYGEMLSKMMEDPSGFLESPLYQSAFGYGTQAVARIMGSKGFIGSGNMATGLQSFGMSKANDMFMEAAKFISHLAGADIAGNAGPGLSGMSDASGQMNDVFGQLGAIFEGLPGLGGGAGGGDGSAHFGGLGPGQVGGGGMATPVVASPI